MILFILGLTVLNVVFAMIFGCQYSIGDEEFEKLMHSTTLFVRGFEYDSFIDVFPILRYLPNRRIKTLQHAIELRTPIVKKHLELHKASFHKRASKNKDLCYALLEQLEQAKIDGSAKQEYLTDELMVAVLDDMIGAGSETTLTVLRWSVVYLVNNDDVQEECYHEILNMIGRDKPIELSDRKLLPYVNAFVHETLRMSSIAPMAVPHKTTSDTSLGGYKIPKNSQVLKKNCICHFFDVVNVGKHASKTRCKSINISQWNKVYMFKTVASFNLRKLSSLPFSVSSSSSYFVVHSAI